MHAHSPLFLVLLLVSHFACSPVEDSAEAEQEAPNVSTLQLEVIDKVVAITEPVAAFPAGASSSGVAAATSFNQLILGSGLVASQGVSLGEKANTIKSRFATANGNKAFCETVNNAMKFFREASQSDFNLCLLKKAAAGRVLLASEPQIWDFNGMSSEGSLTFRLRFSLETADDNTLKRFESFSCMASGSSSLKQDGYVLQTVTEGQLAILARAESDLGAAPVKIKTQLTAELNDKGRPVGLKTIQYAEQSDGRSVRSKVTQSDKNIQTIGYETSSVRTTQSLSFVELLDSNSATGQYAVTKLAYGDGAALLRITESNGSPSNQLASWNGDTLLSDSSEERRGKVIDRSAEYLSPNGDNLDLSFASSEIYDCSGEANETINLSQSDMLGCFNAYDIDQDGSTMCNGLSY